MRRRKFIQQGVLAGAGMVTRGHGRWSVPGDGIIPARAAIAGAVIDDGGADFPVVRTPEAQRKFRSEAVEKTIRVVRENIGNKEIGWLFENCFPNTLDTTVDYSSPAGRPDTYVITGDIDAMWLRDSSAQVWPYLSLCREDKDLRQMIRGVIHRQVICILRDPYANAFYKNADRISEWKATDVTAMKPGIHERKWEIDSLCYPIRLARGYWEVTGDRSPFDNDWLSAMGRVLETFRQQQRMDGEGPYSFQRKSQYATDSVPMGGYGYPTKKVGLIHSMFRPSDDATIFPFLIPSNLFALSSLRDLRTLLKALGTGKDLEGPAFTLETQLESALIEHAIVTHPVFGEVFAYEVDGFGNHTLMDDANVPSLLALPYIQSVLYNGDLSVLHNDKRGYAVYQNTRRMLWSDANPFFFKGRAGEGIGGPHVGLDMVWPISVIIRALTSHDSQEIAGCLKMLQHSHAGTGFMHESFHKDDAAKYTRKWFAWANTLFGELVLRTYRQSPALLS